MYYTFTSISILVLESVSSSSEEFKTPAFFWFLHNSKRVYREMMLKTIEKNYRYMFERKVYFIIFHYVWEMEGMLWNVFKLFSCSGFNFCSKKTTTMKLKYILHIMLTFFHRQINMLSHRHPFIHTFIHFNARETIHFFSF